MRTITKFIYLGFAALAVACFTLSPTARAVVPPPDGAYPNFTTAEGKNALQSLTTGAANTALGAYSLFSTTTASFNTAVGVAALDLNTGDSNTAVGVAALLLNTGTENTAVGVDALGLNTAGEFNAAIGAFALYNNTTGTFNTANGTSALFNNIDGSNNSAFGYYALFENMHAGGNTAIGNSTLVNNLAKDNTAVGANALFSNTDGDSNTAVGHAALGSNTTGVSNTATGAGALLSNTTGSRNIAVGDSAGANTTGDVNIDIGSTGIAGESGTIRIGNSIDHARTFIAAIHGVNEGGTGILPVYINSAGQLGTSGSSRRFKAEIKPMDSASEAILALNPVTFHYKDDDTNTPQFGLIAEDVAEVNSDLVVRDKNGEIYTVRYEAVNAMLLNEFLKEHRKVEKLEATLAQQHKDFEAAVAELKGQIQKVSAQLELSKSAPQTVLNNH